MIICNDNWNYGYKMKYDPDIHHRRSIRLKHYDYSQPGAYFVTIVTHQRQCLFGKNFNGKMQLNECGEITNQFWMEIPKHYPHASLDEFVIMPNHIHGIIILNDVGVQKFESLQLELNKIREYILNNPYPFCQSTPSFGHPSIRGELKNRLTE